MTRPTEDQCEDTIIAAAQLAGWRVHTERKARTSNGWRTPVKGTPGWPDIFMTRAGRAVAVELKRKPNDVTEDQWVWLQALGRAGIEAHVVWVPEQMQAFIDRVIVAGQEWAA